MGKSTTANLQTCDLIWDCLTRNEFIDDIKRLKVMNEFYIDQLVDILDSDGDGGNTTVNLLTLWSYFPFPSPGERTSWTHGDWGVARVKGNYFVHVVT